MNSNLCPDCGQDHSGLPALWPVGAEVVTRAWYVFKAKADVVRVFVGTPGKVTGHTIDGRPLVIFEGYTGAHSFHRPEEALKLVTDDKGEYWPDPTADMRER